MRLQNLVKLKAAVCSLFWLLKNSSWLSVCNKFHNGPLIVSHHDTTSLANKNYGYDIGPKLSDRNVSGVQFFETQCIY